MRGVQPGHAEIQREKQRRVRRIGAAFAIEIVPGHFVMHTLIVIFIGLHAEEGAAQQQSQNQEQHDQILFPDRRRKVHRQRHRQTAADQHGRIGRADQEIGLVAGRGERRRIGLPVHEIRQEQAAEEHDFGDQKHPHPDRRSVLLLLRVLEMMLERL